MRRFGAVIFAGVIVAACFSSPALAWGKKKKKVSIEINTKVKKEKNFVYNSHGKKDPMLPVVDSNGNVLFVKKKTTGETTVNITIQGIIFKRKGNSKVMINNILYKEGDKIGMMTIKKINKDNIIVTDGVKEYKVDI